MNQRIGEPTTGLCATCEYRKSIVSAKGSEFTLCNRSRLDARFPKYPRLPVLACAGYQPNVLRNYAK